MKKTTKKLGPSEPKAYDKAFAKALRKIDADKEWLADVKDALQAKRPQDAKRFTVPAWYLAPGAIKALRKQLKVSQSQLADNIGVNVKTVQLWEQKTGALGPGSILLRLLVKYPGLYAELKA
jgi:DNA-binding transcriptional regulator YiaG